MGGATCGNGAVETGETCDDGNTAAGDGCSASCQMEQTATPKLTATPDKTTIATELKTVHPITVSLAGSGGFGETVNLTARVVDSSDVAITGWTVALDNSSMAIPTNGTASVIATLTVPSKNTALAGTVKIDITSSLGTQTVSTDVTATNQVTFTLHVDNNTGLCVYPTDAGTQGARVPVSIGTKVRFYNDGTANLVIHTNNANGITHQGQSPNGLADPTTEPNTAYELPLTGTAGTSVNWYCHDPATDIGTNDPGIAASN